MNYLQVINQPSFRETLVDMCNTISSAFDNVKKGWVQVIFFEIDCAIVYTNLHELFCQFISQPNWVNSGKFMDNC